MCGIAGIIAKEKEESLQAQLTRMIEIINHRGPDGKGIYSHKGICLGHRRLSIIDIESGKQPMHNEDKSLWVVFNGEIYNFLELKEELENKGHRFKTRSDTEVILHAYEEYGSDFVTRLKGMFAFALWDVANNSLLLVRDRLGKKPLYYTMENGRLIFASEIKSILQCDNVRRKLNNESLRDYFSYLYVPFSNTIFSGISKLPPAHMLTVKFSKDMDIVSSALNQYWDVNFAPDYSLNETACIEILEEKLIESVRSRLISDVPLGAFLSGGLDSSSIVAYMSNVSSGPVKTFSIGFEDDSFSELKYARKVADLFKTDHHEFIVKPDAIDVLPKLTWQYDEPFADSSSIPTYYVSKMAREHVTVILSGDGGDEVFAGYEKYSALLKYQKLNFIPSFLRKALFGTISSSMPEGMKGKGILKHLSNSDFERFAGIAVQTAPVDLSQVLCPDFQSNNSSRYQFIEKYFRAFPGTSELSKMQYVDIKTYLAEDILTKVDRASMLCSLETRAPLLDHELIEFVATIPPGILMKNGEKKHLLKKVMEKHLPNDIIYRKKKGFDIPLSKWFKNDLDQYARDLLLSKRSRERGIINTKYVEALLDAQHKRARNIGTLIWVLVFFEHWCQNWLDEKSAC